MVWMFAILILNSTYTASLSSRLTVQRLQPAITDVSELIKSRDVVGCQEGSFIVDFLIKKGFDKSRIRIFTSPYDCDEALSIGRKSGGISAYYDSTMSSLLQALPIQTLQQIHDSWAYLAHRRLCLCKTFHLHPRCSLLVIYYALVKIILCCKLTISCYCI